MNLLVGDSQNLVNICDSLINMGLYIFTNCTLCHPIDVICIKGKCIFVPLLAQRAVCPKLGEWTFNKTNVVTFSLLPVCLELCWISQYAMLLKVNIEASAPVVRCPFRSFTRRSSFACLYYKLYICLNYIVGSHIYKQNINLFLWRHFIPRPHSHLNHWWR